MPLVRGESMEKETKPQLQCPLYPSGPLGKCEICDRSSCGLRLLISRLNRLEVKVRNLERGGPRP